MPRPILVTVANANGDSTATWFILTLTSLNLPPTNSLTGLPATNMLANTALTIPFTVGECQQRDQQPDLFGCFRQ